jgi:hypothetical protein
MPVGSGRRIGGRASKFARRRVKRRIRSLGIMRVPKHAACGDPSLKESIMTSATRPRSFSVATAHGTTLVALLPQQQAAVEQAVSAALAVLPDGAAKEQGVRAAAAVLAGRADEMPGSDNYRPHAAAGQYVPTVAPAANAWVRRKPWLMASPSAAERVLGAAAH